jgi:hypothetical protein
MRQLKPPLLIVEYLLLQQFTNRAPDEDLPSLPASPHLMTKYQQYSEYLAGVF